ncbi:DUF1642 domain-containing protein [Enterococcus faecalis]|jgi:hypothetical protein|uniref:DUF1642 domain-containing protein n=3 Tax=root TaxID=1 RepID=D2IYV1_9CAUD|nr:MULTISPECIES: DUF1642 domain-containing protein [Enterococcus]YP_003347486.1 DUF1642 domain-containing protein [Enterococcus phage phiFL1A]ACZ63789.1 conserved hypothetical protein [Enterococcus phage phiFL1B]MDU1380611.1 DUF1642 domain-containing protein [Klebsiella michiganensis]ACZ63728.1 conserved hypothetical protein [Enterococcus phage phiFL1A]EGO6036643.1 DUF1642 domain-containing protein [Enterococcus faecalis]EHU9644839.1 DUF1642 domain-containing protein [Enterococcus faecalis]
MIKQELIGILEGLEGDSFIEKYNEGYDQAVRDCLIAVKQLDESKKTVLPKKADDFIKEGEGLGSDKVDIIDSAISFARAMPNDEFSLWFKSNRNLFVNALANGYEVEKEPLYHVLLPDKGATNTGYTFLNLTGTIDFTICKEKVDMLTENQIKAIDERYWAFAVKVEG